MFGGLSIFVAGQYLLSEYWRAVLGKKRHHRMASTTFLGGVSGEDVDSTIARGFIELLKLAKIPDRNSSNYE